MCIAGKFARIRLSLLAVDVNWCWPATCSIDARQQWYRNSWNKAIYISTLAFLSCFWFIHEHGRCASV